MSFFKKNKKVIIIVGIIFSVVLITSIITFVLLGRQEVEEPFTETTSEDYKEVYTSVTENEIPQEQIQQVEENSPTPLSDSDVSTLEVKNFNQEGFYFFSQEQNAIISIEDGEEKVIYQFDEQVVDVILSPDLKKSIAVVDPETRFYVNFETGEKSYLPQGIQNLSWSPDSEQIVYQYVNVFQRKNTINVAVPNFSNWRVIYEQEDTGFFSQAIDFDWSAPSAILFKYLASDPSGSPLNILDPQTGNIKGLDIGNVYSYTSSNDGKLLLFDRAVVEGEVEVYKVFVYNFDNSEIIETNIETVAGKCVFETATKVICAVSQEFYNPQASEVLVRYDLESGQKEVVTVPDAESIVNYSRMYYLDGILYYINNIDNKLYQLQIE